MKKSLLLLIFFANILFSQVGMGTANPRGALDINKETTNNMGLVLPTNADPRNMINPMGGNVAIGTLMYDSTLSCVRVFKSTGWSNCLCDQCGPTPGFTLDCSSGAVTGTFTAGTQSNGSKVINYTNATGQSYPALSIVSTGVTGLVASAPAGTLANGNGSITLVITGTPSSEGMANFNISIGGQSCTFMVNIGRRVFRRMNVLGVAAEPWYAPLDNNTYASRAILTSTQNFGLNGTFSTGGFNIISTTSAQGQALKDLINNNNIDIIIVGYSYIPNDASITVLNDFVKNKKGVLMYSEEYSSTQTPKLINMICGGSGTTMKKIGGSEYDQLTNVNDPVLNGPFGDVRGKIIGSDWTSTSFYVQAGLPSGVTILANRFNDTSMPLMFKHSSLGFIYMGDSGWLGGSATDTRNTIFPVGMNASGVPITKPWIGNTTSYNGFLYANAIAWAVQFAQSNTNTNYIVP